MFGWILKFHAVSRNKSRDILSVMARDGKRVSRRPQPVFVSYGVYRRCVFCMQSRFVRLVVPIK